MKEKKTSTKFEEIAGKASAAASELGKKAGKAKKAAAKKFDEVSDKVSDVAEWLSDTFEESAEKTKKVASGIGKWRKKSSKEEKFTTILGIILLICALRELREFIWGVLLLLVGILWVSWYFDEYLESLFDKKTSKKD